MGSIVIVIILILIFSPFICESKSSQRIVLQQNMRRSDETSQVLDKILENFLSQLAPENPQDGNYCDIKITGPGTGENYEKFIQYPFLRLNSQEFQLEFDLKFPFTQMIFTTATTEMTTSLRKISITKEKKQSQFDDDFNISKNNFFDIRRLSFQCSTALVFLEQEAEPKSAQNSAAKFIENVRNHSGNRRSESTHFIFISKESNQIQRIFEENQEILRLKYKTGIFIRPEIPSHHDNSKSELEIKIMSESNPERKFKFMSKMAGNPLVVGVPKFSFPFCNLCGGKISVAAFNLEPYVVLNEKKQPILGYFYNVLNAFKNHFNLTTTEEFSAPGIKQLPNGSWTGYVNDLIVHRLDLVSPLGVTHDRFPYLDFTTYLSIDDLVFYTGHPQKSVNWQAIFYPFQPCVWLLIGISLVVSIPIFYLQMTLPSTEAFSLLVISRFPFGKKPRENSHRKAVIENKYEQGMSRGEARFYAVILPFSALLQEARKIPHRVRYLYGGFLFYSIVLGVCYNSNLISFLTFPQSEKMPGTFEELSKRHDFTQSYMSYPGSVGDVFFQQTKNPIFLRIQQRLVYTRNYPQCITTAALERNNICVAWPNLADSIISQNLSLHPNFNPLKKSDSAMGLVLNLVMPRYSKYYSGFNEVAGWIRDTGFMQFWREEAINYRRKSGRRWMMSQKDVKGSLYTKLDKVTREILGFGNLKPFGLDNFVVCFASLILGLVLSVLSFLFEIEWIKVSGTLKMLLGKGERIPNN